MSKETLDLAAVFDRDDVKLRDGKVYEIRNPEEFGMVDDHRLNALTRERIPDAQKKANARGATEEDAQHASSLLRELATLLLIDFPKDGELGDWECVAIFDFHMKRRLEYARKLAEEAGVKLPPPPRALRDRQKSAKKRQTSGSSSRGSRRSTAGRRKTG